MPSRFLGGKSHTNAFWVSHLPRESEMNQPRPYGASCNRGKRVKEFLAGGPNHFVLSQSNLGPDSETRRQNVTKEVYSRIFGFLDSGEESR